jgi:hypothetical protein
MRVGARLIASRDVILHEMLQWTIRSQAPKAREGTEKVQRLDGGGCRPRPVVKIKSGPVRDDGDQ